jgi:ankyrin repeat protein
MPTEAMEALYRGDLDEAKRLLPPDEELTTAEAAAFGRMERLQALLDDDPSRANEWSDDGFGPLALAIFGGHEECARLLIDRGADLETPSRHERIRGIRPIHTAAFVRSVELTRLLLDAGADVNGRGEGGFTGLHSAAQNGDVELVRLLLERGADRTLATEDGRRPADLATGETASLLQ